MTTNLRILLADDDQMLREGLARLLNEQDGVEVVATAENGALALAQLAQHTVDLALLDIDMPVLDGVQTAKALLASHPGITVVMLTAFEHEETLAESLALNIKGFLTKDIPAPQLAELLVQAHQGQMVMSPRPTQVLTADYAKRQGTQAQYADFIAAVQSLPPYLRGVFDLLIQAKTNRSISRELHLSEATVRSYISEIFVVTGYNNRGELAITALKAGISK